MSLELIAKKLPLTCMISYDNREAQSVKVPSLSITVCYDIDWNEYSIWYGEAELASFNNVDDTISHIRKLALESIEF